MDLCVHGYECVVFAGEVVDRVCVFLDSVVEVPDYAVGVDVVVTSVWAAAE